MLSVIVPTYNEAENLSDFISTLDGALRNIEHEVIIVDDNSPDGTGDIAESFKKKYTNVLALRRLKKLGLASAVMKGAEEARGEIVATLNSDFQHPIKYLATLYDYIDKYDIVIASRYINKAELRGWDKSRIFFSKFATFITHLILPGLRGIKDPLSGYFIFRKEIIKNTHIEVFGPKFLLSLLIECNAARIIEIPYVFEGRRRGKSKASLYDGILFLGYLLKGTYTKGTYRSHRR